MKYALIHVIGKDSGINCWYLIDWENVVIGEHQGTKFVSTKYEAVHNASDFLDLKLFECASGLFWLNEIRTIHLTETIPHDIIKRIVEARDKIANPMVGIRCK